ncbi:hypothetical protein [Brevibacillus agri]|uniref:hypothetical protein n=1 Tax=Brevibacillus agri TaxID=51101 RepID=UPI001F5CA5D6|nr:hypothetical protein [Brevibacillus agri]
MEKKQDMLPKGVLHAMLGGKSFRCKGMNQAATSVTSSSITGWSGGICAGKLLTPKPFWPTPM